MTTTYTTVQTSLPDIDIEARGAAGCEMPILLDLHVPCDHDNLILVRLATRHLSNCTVCNTLERRYSCKQLRVWLVMSCTLNHGIDMLLSTGSNLLAAVCRNVRLCRATIEGGSIRWCVYGNSRLFCISTSYVCTGGIWCTIIWSGLSAGPVCPFSVSRVPLVLLVCVCFFP